MFAVPVSAMLSAQSRWLGFDRQLLAIDALSGNAATVGSDQV
jgi:hypothetical protein